MWCYCGLSGKSYHVRTAMLPSYDEKYMVYCLQRRRKECVLYRFIYNKGSNHAALFLTQGGRLWGKRLLDLRLKYPHDSVGSDHPLRCVMVVSGCGQELPWPYHTHTHTRSSETLKSRHWTLGSLTQSFGCQTLPLISVQKEWNVCNTDYTNYNARPCYQSDGIKSI